MKFVDKVIIIIGFISTLLMMWHLFAPSNLRIDGFYGTPCIICGAIIGYCLAHGLEKLNQIGK